MHGNTECPHLLNIDFFLMFWQFLSHIDLNIPNNLPRILQVQKAMTRNKGKREEEKKRLNYVGDYTYNISIIIYVIAPRVTICYFSRTTPLINRRVKLRVRDLYNVVYRYLQHINLVLSPFYTNIRTTVVSGKSNVAPLWYALVGSNLPVL